MTEHETLDQLTNLATNGRFLVARQAERVAWAKLVRGETTIEVWGTTLRGVLEGLLAEVEARDLHDLEKGAVWSPATSNPLAPVCWGWWIESKGLAGWLAAFLEGRPAKPHVMVPADFTPLTFIKAALDAPGQENLARRFGDAAWIALRGELARPAPGPLAIDLASLLAFLPLSDEVENEAQPALARVLALGAAPDAELHRALLAALAAQVKPEAGRADRWRSFFEDEMSDPRFAGVAFGGLTELSVPWAIEAVPRLVETLDRGAPPVEPHNALFALALEMGEDASSWGRLGSTLRDAGEPIRRRIIQVLAELGLPPVGPGAYDVFHAALEKKL